MEPYLLTKTRPLKLTNMNALTLPPKKLNSSLHLVEPGLVDSSWSKRIDAYCVITSNINIVTVMQSTTLDLYVYFGIAVCLTSNKVVVCCCSSNRVHAAGN